MRTEKRLSLSKKMSKLPQKVTEQIILDTLKNKLETDTKNVSKLVKIIKKDPTYKEYKNWLKELSENKNKNKKKSRNKSVSRKRNRTRIRTKTKNKGAASRLSNMSVISGGTRQTTRESDIHRYIRLTVWGILVLLMFMSFYFEPTHSTLVSGIKALYNGGCNSIRYQFSEKVLGISNPVCYIRISSYFAISQNPIHQPGDEGRLMKLNVNAIWRQNVWHHYNYHTNSIAIDHHTTHINQRKDDK